MNTSITFARDIQTGKIIHVQEADNGLSCNCQCVAVACEENLVAIQGKERVWHFRHDVNKSCTGGQETALHEISKQIIADNKKIRITSTEEFTYDNATIEKPIDKYFADVIIKNDTDELIIEIAVTHPIDEKKENFYKSSELRAVEIDLKKVDRQISLEQLEQLLLTETSNKRLIVKQNDGCTTAILSVLALLGIAWLLTRKN